MEGMAADFANHADEGFGRGSTQIKADFVGEVE